MARDVESLRQTAVMDPSLAEMVKKRPFIFDKPDDFFASRESRAAHLRTLRHLMPVPGPIPDVVREREFSVPARDGHQIRVVHYAPAQKAAGSSPPAPPPPLVVLYHEGGWCMGDLSDEEFNARLLVRELGVVCLNVEYRLAPEHLYPTWIHDSWDVLQWAAANAVDTLGADPTKGFIVGGSSAGGNIAGILAHLARAEEGGLTPPLTGQWLSVPFLIPSAYVPDLYRAGYLSMRENIHDPVLLGGDSLEVDVYGLTQADPASPLVSVVASEYYPPTEKNQKGRAKMAKAFFQVAGMDPLRDHGLVYDRILREEYHVETRLNLYAGFGHMFWANWPELEESVQWATDMVDGFRWLLS